MSTQSSIFHAKKKLLPQVFSCNTTSVCLAIKSSQHPVSNLSGQHSLTNADKSTTVQDIMETYVFNTSVDLICDISMVF